MNIPKHLTRIKDGITYVALFSKHGFPISWVPYQRAVELLKVGVKLATKNEIKKVPYEHPTSKSTN